MADQVYDPENQDKKPVEQKEEVAPSHEREIAQPGGFKGLRQSYGDFRKKQKGGDEAAQKRNEGLRNYWQQAKDDDEADDRGFFKSGKDKSASGLSGIFKKKRLIAVIAGGGIIGVLFAFSGLLSTFKADFLMKNIDQKTGLRMNADLNQRSVAYIRAYTEIRMMDVGGDFTGDPDSNLFFRANKISTGNPLFDWYKTLRTSSFEADVFNKNGIYFGSFVNRETNKIVTGYIQVDGTQISPDNMSAIQDAIQKGDWATLDNEFGQFFDKVDLANHSAGRAAIKDLVESNTQSLNVFKQRRMRKAIQEMAGVRQWRVFDETRANASQSIKDFRNNLLKIVVPQDTTMARFMNCFLGINKCSSTDPDPAESANQAGGEITTSETGKGSASDQTGKVTDTYDYADAAQTLSDVFEGVGQTLKITNWLSLLNGIANADNYIYKGGLEASVAVARGVQAMSLYQIMETARDQMQTGQVTSDEVNNYMQWIGNITASEAWVKVVDGQGGTKTAYDSGDKAATSYCQPGHTATESEFAYLCPNTVIGSSLTEANSLSTYYKNGIGKIIHPIAGSYRSILGGFTGAITKWVGEIFSPVINKVIIPVAEVFVPNLKNDVQQVVLWASGQFADYMGAGQMVTSATTSGQLGNLAIEGGAYTVETTMRTNGAALTTHASQSESQTIVGYYQQSQVSQQSFIAKYFSPGNQQSLVANGLFAISQLKFSSIGHVFTNVGSMFHTIASAISLPFTHQALAAANDNGYVAAEVSGIPTYDLPAQCFNLDPTVLATDPAAGTNASTVLGISTVELNKLPWSTWDNDQAWYDYLYQKAGSGNTKVEQVYNCNLFDNAVMGSLGYTSGYTSDYGDGQ